jgi:hypothetical protein
VAERVDLSSGQLLCRDADGRAYQVLSYSELERQAPSSGDA